MEITTHPLSAIQTNAYVVKKGKNFIVIDLPEGAIDDCILPLIEQGYHLEAVLLTHAHYDHILDLPAFVQEFPDVPVYGTSLCEQWASQADTYNWGGANFSSTPLPQSLTVIEANQEIELLGQKWRTLFSDGHCPGSLTFYSAEGKCAFVGDLIFLQSVGRTDLPGSDHKQLETNIKEQIYTLPEETLLYPGHGNKTSVVFEKNNNPFVRI